MPPVQSAAHRYAALKPGVIPLRPLGLGEILDGAISTMRARPALMLGVAAIVVAVAQLLTLAATFPWLDDINRAATLDPYDVNAQSDALKLAGVTLLVTVIGLVFTLVSRVFLSGFVTLVVGTAVLGQKQTFGQVWKRVRPRMMPLLGLTLLYPLIIFGAVLVVAMFLVAVPPLGILVGLGMLVISVWLWVMFSLATPALVLENAGVQRAFGRSRQLVRGAWWRIFGISLLATFIATVLAFIIALPFEFLGDGFQTVTNTQPTPPTTRYLLSTTIGAVLASTITEPFVAAVTVLLYTDRRMRTEGLDIELARAAQPQQ